MIKRIPILGLLVFQSLALQAQSQNLLYQQAVEKAFPQKTDFRDVSIKANVLSYATTSFNLGLEVGLSKYLSLNISADYNPWTFSDNRKFKHLTVRPELRYWLNEPFNGYFLGSHLLYSHFNVGNLDLPLNIYSSLKENRYQGNAYGLGITNGYQWILSPRWSLEGSFSFGYIYADYSLYPCYSCGLKLKDGYKHYFGPSQATISLIYIIQ